MATAKKQKKPAKACECVEQVNEQLKERGAAITRLMQFDFTKGVAGMSPPVIAMHKIGSHKSRKPLPTLCAAYCPFCGKKYPE